MHGRHNHRHHHNHRRCWRRGRRRSRGGRRRVSLQQLRASRAPLCHRCDQQCAGRGVAPVYAHPKAAGPVPTHTSKPPSACAHPLGRSPRPYPRGRPRDGPRPRRPGARGRRGGRAAVEPQDLRRLHLGRAAALRLAAQGVPAHRDAAAGGRVAAARAAGARRRSAAHRRAAVLRRPRPECAGAGLRNATTSADLLLLPADAGLHSPLWD